jgi:hypothetical protein
MRKTLVFYKGRAPHGHKSDWIMHEYRLDDAVSHPGSGDVVPYYSGAPSSSPVRTHIHDDSTIRSSRSHARRPADRYGDS